MQLKHEVDLEMCTFFLQCLTAKRMFQHPWVTSSSKTQAVQIQSASRKTEGFYLTFKTKIILQ